MAMNLVGLVVGRAVAQRADAPPEEVARAGLLGAASPSPLLSVILVQAALRRGRGPGPDASGGTGGLLGALRASPPTARSRPMEDDPLARLRTLLVSGNVPPATAHGGATGQTGDSIGGEDETGLAPGLAADRSAEWDDTERALVVFATALGEQTEQEGQQTVREAWVALRDSVDRLLASWEDAPGE